MRAGGLNRRRQGVSEIPAGDGRNSSGHSRTPNSRGPQFPSLFYLEVHVKRVMLGAAATAVAADGGGPRPAGGRCHRRRQHRRLDRYRINQYADYDFVRHPAGRRLQVALHRAARALAASSAASSRHRRETGRARSPRPPGSARSCATASRTPSASPSIGVGYDAGKAKATVTLQSAPLQTKTVTAGRPSSRPSEPGTQRAPARPAAGASCCTGRLSRARLPLMYCWALAQTTLPTWVPTARPWRRR